MEFIDLLSSQLGLEPEKSKALAGGLVGVVQKALAENGDEGAVAALDDAVPELGEWQQAAQTFMGADAPGSGAGGLTDLLGGALSSLGGGVGGAAGAVALLMPVLGKLGLDESHAEVVAKLLGQFLSQRLDGDVLAQVQKALPFLGGDAGGAIGVLGGLL